MDAGYGVAERHFAWLHADNCPSFGQGRAAEYRQGSAPYHAAGNGVFTAAAGCGRAVFRQAAGNLWAGAAGSLYCQNVHRCYRRGRAAVLFIHGAACTGRYQRLHRHYHENLPVGTAGKRIFKLLPYFRQIRRSGAGRHWCWPCNRHYLLAGIFYLRVGCA